MLIPIAGQRPGVELAMLGGRMPCSGERVFPDAMEVCQGYDTRFYDCHVGEPCDVVCVDGVWHWELGAPVGA